MRKVSGSLGAYTFIPQSLGSAKITRLIKYFRSNANKGSAENSSVNVSIRLYVYIYLYSTIGSLWVRMIYVTSALLYFQVADFPFQ